MGISYYRKQGNKGIRGLKDTIQTIRSRQTIDDMKMLERAKERNRFALETVGELVYLFSQKQIGDKCSCVEDFIPKGACNVCYGTGWVGGYDKYGYESINIGWHTPGLKLVNVEPDKKVLPIGFKIIHGEQKGFIETDWFGLNNVVSFDNYRLQVFRNEAGNIITPYIQFGTESTFSDFSDIESRILGQIKVKFKFTLEKQANIRPPVFELLRFRYQWMVDPLVKIEKGRELKKLELNEQGFNDMIVNVNYFAMPEPLMHTTDFLEFKTSQQRIKITEYNPQDPYGKNLSVDLSTRTIQRDEQYWKVF